jgi:3-dehydroquinate synthase
MLTQIKNPDYPIFFGDAAEALESFLQNQYFSRLIILVDDNTAIHCLPRIADLPALRDAGIIHIHAGELHKNIQTCQEIWSALIRYQADRKALLINLGGGVIGDMGGFAASTFKRGIRFLQIPTTLLSQVDASVGGKLGIDFMGIKNSIGVFQNPETVIIDPAFLQTLSAREIRSGFAEMLKHSLIRDKAQWDILTRVHPETPEAWREQIAASVAIKQAIVAEDPLEKGIRKALNFGHTLGHALESYFLESPQPLLHGEAIAAGMVLETLLSEKLGLLSAAERDSVFVQIARLYPLPVVATSAYPVLLDYMYQDKKNEQQRINCSLLDGLGSIKIDCTPDEDLIRAALDLYNQLISPA